jgi:hypothetical protein
VLVPTRETVVQPNGDFSCLVQRHFVLVTAPNLDEGACAIVNPLGTVDFRGTDWSGGVEYLKVGCG